MMHCGVCITLPFTCREAKNYCNGEYTCTNSQLRIQCCLNTLRGLYCYAGFLRGVSNVLLVSTFTYLDVFFVRFLSFMLSLIFFLF